MKTLNGIPNADCYNNRLLNNPVMMLQLNCKNCIWLESECDATGLLLYDRLVNINGRIKCMNFISRPSD